MHVDDEVDAFPMRGINPVGSESQARASGQERGADVEVVRAEPVQGGVLVSVRDQSNNLRSEYFDCIITGTGFDLEVRRLPFLDRGLLEQIRCTENAPDLNLKFESSVRGLHFVGPLSYMSFGPLFRFAAGAGYAAHVLARHFA